MSDGIVGIPAGTFYGDIEDYGYELATQWARGKRMGVLDTLNAMPKAKAIRMAVVTVVAMSDSDRADFVRSLGTQATQA